MTSAEDLKWEIVKIKEELGEAKDDLKKAKDAGQEHLMIMYGNLVASIQIRLASLEALLPKTSFRRHLRYKGDISTVHSRLLLDSVSHQLKKIFKFEKMHESASFDDIWYNRQATAVIDGQQKLLQDFFTTEQWDYLKALHGFTVGCLHGKQLPTSPHNHKAARIILPTEFNNIRVVSEIAVLSNLIFSKDDITIIDAQELLLSSDRTEDFDSSHTETAFK